MVVLCHSKFSLVRYGYHDLIEVIAKMIKTALIPKLPNIRLDLLKVFQLWEQFCNFLIAIAMPHCEWGLSTIFNMVEFDDTFLDIAIFF